MSLLSCYVCQIQSLLGEETLWYVVIVFLGLWILYTHEYSSDGVKARTIDAKAKAVILNAKARQRPQKFGLEAPRGQGLTSRTPSLEYSTVKLLFLLWSFDQLSVAELSAIIILYHCRSSVFWSSVIDFTWNSKLYTYCKLNVCGFASIKRKQSEELEKEETLQSYGWWTSATPSS